MRGRDTTALVMAALLTAGCDPQPEVLCDGLSCFTFEDFGANIESSLDSCTVGWGYSIYYDGKLHTADSGGFMRTTADSPSIAMNNFEPANIASVSKTLTAIAVLQLLEANSLTADSPIEPWLPPEWTPGDGIEQLTFRQVMTHSAGFRTTLVIAPPWGDSTNYFSGDYDGLRDMVEFGVYSQYQTGQYDNINYQLLRVLIAMLDGLDPSVDPAWPGSAAVATAERYEQYMINNVFVAAGASNATVYTPENAMKYYAFPDDGRAGFDHSAAIPGVYGVDDERSVSGAGFWNIPIISLSSLIWQLRYTDNLLSEDMRNEMFDETRNFTELLGTWSSDVVDGKAFKHNGGFGYSLYGDSDCDGSLPDTWCAGGTSIWYAMPNELVVTMHHNSIPNDRTTCGLVLNPDQLIEDAYNGAWTP